MRDQREMNGDTEMGHGRRAGGATSPAAGSDPKGMVL